MKTKKSGSMIAFLLVFALVSLSVTLFVNDSYSLRVYDRDNDGIVDDLDKCPDFAENYNKFQDDDGCPDTKIDEKTKFEFPDTDGDGIVDRFDNCVNLPETFNDYLDDDGCPERLPNTPNDVTDSDFDSIPDSIDACPFEKETFNEFKDADGCPDSISPYSKTPKEIISQENQCLNGKIPVIRLNAQNPVCVFLDIAKKWEELGIGEITVPISEEKIETKEEIATIPEIEEKFEEPSQTSDSVPAEKKLSEVSSVSILETSKTIIGQDISYPKGTPLISSTIVTIPVGEETGDHVHEYPLFAFVLKGEVTVDYHEEGTKKYLKGDAIMEAINFTHNGINTGDEPTEILVVTIGEE